MKGFEHDMQGNTPKFGHKSGTIYKDDSAYSTNWAIYSLREQEARTRHKHNKDALLGSQGCNQFTGA